MLSEAQRALFDALQDLATRQQVRLFLVGGVVRDLLLGHSLEDKDIDVLVEGDAREFARLAQQALHGELRTFDRFLTAKILEPDGMPGIAEVDFASTRTERYETPGALPIVSLAPFEEDLRRRDFAINAIALPVSELVALVRRDAAREEYRSVVVDPFNGVGDLDRRLVRVLHEQSFHDDPTRIFRAARYAVRIDGSLEPRTEQLLRGAVADGMVGRVSLVRRVNELRHIFEEVRPVPILELLNSHGVCAELGIVPRAQAARIVSMVTALQRLPYSPAQRLEILLSAAYLSWSTEKERISFARALGWGRKRIRPLQQPELYGAAEQQIALRYVRDAEPQLLEEIAALRKDAK